MKLLQFFILVIGVLGVWADVKAQLKPAIEKCVFYVDKPWPEYRHLVHHPFDGKRTDTATILYSELGENWKGSIANVVLKDTYCANSPDKKIPVSPKIIAGGVGYRFVKIEMKVPNEFYEVSIDLMGKK